MQEKTLKYYGSKSKINTVHNIVTLPQKPRFICTPVGMGFVVDKLALAYRSCLIPRQLQNTINRHDTDVVLKLHNRWQ